MQPVFAPWLGTAGGKVQTIAKDHDVFGDGSVLIKATPGHTPGHTSLLVRLPQTGDVLLTCDLYHFQEQAFAHAVPGYNFSRVQTLASMARFDETARNLNAKVIIEHDSRHVGRLGAWNRSPSAFRARQTTSAPIVGGQAVTAFRDMISTSRSTCSGSLRSFTGSRVG